MNNRSSLYSVVSAVLLLLPSTTHGWVSSSSSSTRHASTALFSAVNPIVDSTSTADIEPSDFIQSLPPLAANSRRIFLLRHGETDWNELGLLQGGGNDIELNRHGQEQALQLARELQGADVGVLASSHLERSEQTANRLRQEVFGQAIRVIHHKFGEMKFGHFEGMQIKLSKRHGDNDKAVIDEKEEAMVLHNKQTFLDFQNNILHENKHVPFPSSSTKAGESIADVEERALAAIDQLLEHFDAETVCVVAHGRFNKILIKSLLGLSPSTNIEQGNACINVLDVTYNDNDSDDAQPEWKARVLNHVGHVQKTQPQQAQPKN